MPRHPYSFLILAAALSLPRKQFTYETHVHILIHTYTCIQCASLSGSLWQCTFSIATFLERVLVLEDGQVDGNHVSLMGWRVLPVQALDWAKPWLRPKP